MSNLEQIIGTGGSPQELHIVPIGVRAPVYSGEEGSRDDDLRPVVVISAETIPSGYKIAESDEVIISLR